MWIVRLALRRPYTFVVMAIGIILLGLFAVLRMPTDIFPEVNIPVISVIWRYEGMPPEEMEGRIIRSYEGIVTTTVNDVEHIESQSLNGEGVVRIYFQPGARIEEAEAQVAAVSQTALHQMPPGIQPPLIMRYSASTVPILWLSLGSNTLAEQQLFDITNNFIRNDLATVQGAMLPWPYGGKQREIMVDLDPQKLYGFGLSAADVSKAINDQNLILPAGSARIGTHEYYVRINSSPTAVDQFNDLPIKTVNGSTIFIKDVAHVSDKYTPQINMVHIDGKKGVLEPIYKLGNASTLDIVKRVKAALPSIMARVNEKDLRVTPLFDQSIFVRAAVLGVVKEAAIAAGLTGLMILLFLGSWRSTLIICISIPLSILVSLIILWMLGETLNVMTLGGMALAVGILVDDATVEIENIHRNLHQRKRLVQAILDGAQQIAVPAFVSTLCICIVFVPVWFITGAARSLFTPLAMAVVFAMLTSYLLSRTLVPTLVHYFLAGEVELYGGQLDPNDPHAQKALHDKEVHEHPELAHVAPRAGSSWDEPVGPSKKKRLIWGVGLIVVAAVALLSIYLGRDNGKAIVGWIKANVSLLVVGISLVAMLIAIFYLNARTNFIWRGHQRFNNVFEKFRAVYGGYLAWALLRPKLVLSVFTLFVVGSCALYPLVGRDFFPSVDAGQIRLHVRGPAGTRIEESEHYFGSVEKFIRTQIPSEELGVMIDNIGIPNSGINMSLSDGSQISPADGEILINLKEDHHPTGDYVKKLRRELPTQFPDLSFWFQSADIATQILNFGLPAPIDVQVLGPKTSYEKDREIAQQLRQEMAAIPGCVDVHVHQVSKTPDLRVVVDRTRADQLGVDQNAVASDLLISLSSSGQTAPNFWLDPYRGISYQVAVMTPQYKMTNLSALENTPVISPNASDPQLLGNLATVNRGLSPTNITHYDAVPTFDVEANNAQGADLGSVATSVEKLIQKITPTLPRGTTIAVRGQVESMESSFKALAIGVIGAVILVYLLMVVNFQSWMDPLIILMALPGAIAGILWMLFATRTTISVPSLMGSIMCIGVATANSILMITFANDYRKERQANAHDAALAAGMTRLRPVIMTALAMIIGMLPMSLGLGEGGEQNAPLGRAVIGGLAFATIFTLFFVPLVYSLRKSAPYQSVEPELQD